MQSAWERLESPSLGIFKAAMATHNSAEVILANSVDGCVLSSLFCVTSTWSYSLHKLRLKLLEKLDVII